MYNIRYETNRSLPSGFHRNSLFKSFAFTLLGAVLIPPAGVMVAGEVEEIVVTATKRAERLLDVPSSITALGADELVSNRILELRDIAQEVPNFNIGGHGPSGPELTIRGIGSDDREAGSERSVVVFVDEVYVGRAGSSSIGLYDLERVEVLRGPQGTLFGRNVVGGLVHYLTAEPKFERSSMVNFGIGNLNLKEVEGYMTGALSDTVAARVAAKYRSKQGFYRARTFNNERQEDSEGVSARVKFLYEPSDDFRGSVAVEVSQDKLDGIGAAFTQGDETDERFFGILDRLFGGYDFFIPDDSRSFPIITDTHEFGEFDRSMAAITAKVEWDTSIGTVTFIPAYRHSSFEEVRGLISIPFTDGDPVIRFDDSGLPMSGFSSGFGFESSPYNDEVYTSASAELRLTSDSDDSDLDWIVGLYLLDENVERVQLRERNLGRLVGGMLANQISRTQLDQKADIRSAAVFANLRYHFSDKLSVSLGGRYTSDKKDFFLDLDTSLDAAKQAAVVQTIPSATISFSPASAPFVSDESDTFREFTPDFTVDFRPTSDSLLYAKVSTGFKSGGFNGIAADQNVASVSFQPETALNLDVGAKGLFFDRSLQLAVSAFQMDFDNLQVRDRLLRIPGDEASATIQVVNAANAEISGVEVEVDWRPNDNISVTASAAHLDTEILEVNPGSTLQVGTRLPRSPKYTANLGASYFAPLDNGMSLEFSAKARHVGEQYLGPNNGAAGFEDSYTTLNARVTLAAAGGWSVTAWGKNLTEEIYRTKTQVALGSRTGILSRFGEPRTYGLSVNYKFQ